MMGFPPGAHVAPVIVAHNEVMPDLLEPLRAHPLFQIADLLSEYTGIRRDLIQLVEFLSLAAGHMVMPMNIDVYSDQFPAELHLANRVLDLMPERVSRVETYQQFHALEEEGFDKLAVILVRGSHPRLYRQFIECTSRTVGPTKSQPSIWRFSDKVPKMPAVPTLRLMASQDTRCFDGFGSAFAVCVQSEHEQPLRTLIEELPRQPRYAFPSRPEFQGKVAPENLLVLERLLQLFAAFRIRRGDTEQITVDDYNAVRALLIHLPLTPIDRTVSPLALATAETIYGAVAKDSYRLYLPDRSAEGDKWFTRQDVVDWTGLGYSSAKTRLKELEADGIVGSTLGENHRQRGRQIHFRFSPNRVPPFGWRNPFGALPML